jgi:hypothetical protein
MQRHIASTQAFYGTWERICGQLRRLSWKPFLLTLQTLIMLLTTLIFFGTLVERTRVSLLAPKIMPKKSNRLKRKKKIKNHENPQTISHNTSSQFPLFSTPWPKKKCSNYDISAEKQREENEIFLKKNFIWGVEGIFGRGIEGEWCGWVVAGGVWKQGCTWPWRGLSGNMPLNVATLAFWLGLDMCFCSRGQWEEG